MLEGMHGPAALALGWGYAEGDPRWVGAIVIAVAVAAVAFIGYRAAAAIRTRRDPR
jgi:uncharacterized membrane protein YfcA